MIELDHKSTKWNAGSCGGEEEGECAELHASLIAKDVTHVVGLSRLQDSTCQCISSPV